MSGPRFRLIDASNRADHPRLEQDDKCLFLFEYTSRRNYSFSETNGLINNLKKKPSRFRGTSSWKYKTSAIQSCSLHMRQALSPVWLATATLVPVPSSKALDHPDYDDRVEQICRNIGPAVDVRALVRQTISMDAAHEAATGPRPTVSELVAHYEIVEALAHQRPTTVGIVDDVLTAGTHFKAMQRVIQMRFPEADIFGLFVARRIFPVEPAMFDAVEDL